MKTLIPGDEKDRAGDGEAMHRELEIDTLARTIWGEARGEGPKGMEAVASVVMNRARISAMKGRCWWGNSIIQVCQKPYQFSCWNKDDPNYVKLLNVNDRNMDFATAVKIARRAVYGALADPTGGATHYHAAGADPFWTRGQRPVIVLGRHVFYKIAD